VSAGPLRKKAPPRLLTTLSAERPGLLSIAEAAARLGISVRSAYEWANRGVLPGLVVVNNRRYVLRLVLERFLDGE